MGPYFFCKVSSVDTDFRQLLRASEGVLHSAAHGRIEPLRKAIADGGDVNFQSMDNGPVMLAVRNNHAECLALLLEHGANPSPVTRSRWSPLHEASFHNQEHLVEALLAHHQVEAARLDIDKNTALMVAINQQAERAFDALIKATPDDLLDHQNWDGETALFLATKQESQTMVAQLVARGANPTLANADGLTPAEAAGAAGWSLGQTLLSQARRSWEARTQGATPAVGEETPGLAEPEPAESAPLVRRLGKRKFG